MKKLFRYILVMLVLIVAYGCIKPGQSPIEKNVTNCGGLAGIKCPVGYECKINYSSGVSDNAGECIQIQKINISKEIACELGKKYEASKMNPFPCKCPASYVADSRVIGYYREGDEESPILEFECCPDKNGNHVCDMVE